MKDIPSFGALMDGGRQRCLMHQAKISHGHSAGLHKIHIILMLIKPFGDSSCNIDGAIVILEETTSIRVGMFHNGMKVINQGNLLNFFILFFTMTLHFKETI